MDSERIDIVLDCIFDEKKLEERSIDQISFAIENLLLLIDNSDTLDKNAYLANIDNDMCYFYSKIRNEPALISYANTIRPLLTGTMNRQKVTSLRAVLVDMNTTLNEKTENDITVKCVL